MVLVFGVGGGRCDRGVLGLLCPGFFGLCDLWGREMLADYGEITERVNGYTELGFV